MNQFIYYFLKSSADEINRVAPGTTFKEVSGKFVRQLPFPLVPLEEQSEIVAKLDILLALMDELEVTLSSKKEGLEQMIDALDDYIFCGEHEKDRNRILPMVKTQNKQSSFL